jgi:hypothetical protein
MSDTHPVRSRRRNAAASSGGAVIALRIDGSVHTVHVGELCALDAKDLRRQSGLSLAATLKAAQEDPDLDVVAALVWLARRQRGEDVTFDDVAGELGYDAVIEAAEPEKAEDILPEA